MDHIDEVCLLSIMANFKTDGKSFDDFIIEAKLVWYSVGGEAKDESKVSIKN